MDLQMSSLIKKKKYGKYYQELMYNNIKKFTKYDKIDK